MSNISLTIRLSNADKVVVEADRTDTVLALKQKIEVKLNVPAAQQRLIYKGRVLKDESTLEFYSIENEHTVHMVKGSAPAGATTTATTNAPVATTPPAAPSARPAPANPFGAPVGNTDPFGSFGGDQAMLNSMMMNPNLMSNPQAMQQHLMQNPAMMQSLMNSPMMQNMMDNPELMRSMMMNNPQMQAIMDRNPQLRQVLNDPATMRQTMEMMRNPAVMQQVMRSQELQISQLENHPLGYAALRRMQEDIADPMMEAAQESHAQAQSQVPNPWGAPAAAANNGTGSSPSATTPTTDALPNPWGAPANSGGAGAFGGGAPAGAGAGAGAGGFPGMGAGFGGGFGGMGGGFGGMPPMDGNQMAALMNNPMMQQQMAAMMNDPAMLQQMAAMNPQIAPMLNNPQFRAMLSNPEYIRQMMNPAAIQAAMRMQQSGMMPGYGGYGYGGGGYPFAPPPPNNAMGGLDFSNLLNSPGAAGTPPAFPSFPAAAPAPAPAVAPNVRYATQLAQLQAMGFTDDDRSIQVLQQCGGNVNVAVERLLSGN